MLFSEILNCKHVVFEQELEGEVFYFDLVDREEYLRILNIILKWAWPIAQKTTGMEEPTKSCIQSRCGEVYF